MHLNKTIGVVIDRVVRPLLPIGRRYRRHLGVWLTGAVAAATGLSLTTALFGYVDVLSWRDIPLPESDRLVAIQSTRGNGSQRGGPVSPRLINELAQFLDIFESIGAIGPPVVDPNQGIRELAGIRTYSVSPNLFQVVHVVPAVGRVFLPSHGSRSTTHDAVISHRLWTSRFGASREILDRTLSFGDVQLHIVGVLPQGVRFPWSTDLWTEARLLPEQEDFEHLFGVGRLRDGITIEQANARLLSVYPVDAATPTGRVFLTDLREFLYPESQAWLVYVLAACLLGLVVGWLQLAGIQLAGAAARQSELGVRLCLGASQNRIVSEAILEGVILAGVVLVATWVTLPMVIDATRAMMPPDLLFEVPGPDSRLLAFALVVVSIGVVTLSAGPIAVLYGVPAITLIRGTIGSSSGRSFSRLVVWVAASQVAVGAVTLYCASASALAYIRLTQMHLGLDPNDLVQIRLEPVRTQSIDRAAIDDLMARVSLRMSKHPGVVNVAATDTPLFGTGMSFTTSVEVAGASRMPPVQVRSVTPGYFDVLRTRVLKGGTFDRATQQGEDVVVVNESFAKLIGGIDQAIDTSVVVVARRRRITGVVEDTLDDLPNTQVRPQVFMQSAQFLPVSVVLVRTRATGAVLVQDIEGLISDEAGPQVGLASTRVARVVADRSQSHLARARLLILVAVAACALSTLGMLNAVTYAIRSREREFGVRVALGISSLGLVWLTVRSIVMLSFIGTIVGLGAAMGGLRLLGSRAVGVQAWEPSALAIGLMGVALVAVLAGIKAWARVSRLDPARLLANE